MAEHGLDALIVCSSVNDRNYTSRNVPHEWHDCIPMRAEFYVLTPRRQGSEVLNTT